MERMIKAIPGLVLFSAIMMVVIGVFQAIAGLSAILEDDFVVLTEDYVFKFSVTTWGWIHLIGGVIVVLAGIYILQGKTWAIVIGMIVAALSAIVNFMYIPYYPFWSILIIAIDIVIIWALATYGNTLRELED